MGPLHDYTEPHSTGTLFLGSPRPPPNGLFFETLNSTRLQIEKVSTANCASASLSDSLICTHPKGGWTPDVASCLPPPDVQKKTSTRVTFACPLRGHVELVLPSAGEGMVKKCGPAESARWIRSCCEGVVTSTPQHGRQRNVSRPISPLPVLKPATLCRLSVASP